MGRRVDPAEPSLGAIYVGDVVHKRARPKKHALRYRVFSLLVDLDRLEALDKKLRLFSLNRLNFVSFFTRDFGPRDGTSIAAFIRRKAEAAGVGDVVKSVHMLAYPRIANFAFNPLTLYFCNDEAGRTRFLVHEVSNTFGEHHFYQSVVDEHRGELRHEAKKAFYVSPFNTLDGNYRFAVRPPGDKVFMGITLSDAEGGLLTAYFEGERRPLSDGRLAKLLLAYPFMTIKVVLGIHWEALLLWLKGVPTTLKMRRQLKRRHQAE